MANYIESRVANFKTQFILPHNARARAASCYSRLYQRPTLYSVIDKITFMSHKRYSPVSLSLSLSLSLPLFTVICYTTHTSRDRDSNVTAFSRSRGGEQRNDISCA